VLTGWVWDRGCSGGAWADQEALDGSQTSQCLKSTHLELELAESTSKIAETKHAGAFCSASIPKTRDRNGPCPTSAHQPTRYLHVQLYVNQTATGLDPTYLDCLTHEPRPLIHGRWVFHPSLAVAGMPFRHSLIKKPLA
jgi:hypothetical protein